MRTIKKEKPYRPLQQYEREQAAQGLHGSYKDFSDKQSLANLNEALQHEQGKLCCYCMQKLAGFQEKNDEQTGSHNEHFFPQSKYHKQQVDYFNLFASCNALEHCGHKKKNKVLETNILQDPNCSDFFKYNSIGHILPNKGSIEDLKSAQKEANNGMLNSQEVLAWQYITVLNLNDPSLVEKRKREYSNFIGHTLSWPKNVLKAELQKYNRKVLEQKPLDSFIEVRRYLIKRII